MTTQRKHTVTITGTSSISLGDLRWLVAQLAAASDDHVINLTYSEGDRFGLAQSTLSTTVPDMPVKKPSTMRTPNMVVTSPPKPDVVTYGGVPRSYDEAQMEQQNER